LTPKIERLPSCRRTVSHDVLRRFTGLSFSDH